MTRKKKIITVFSFLLCFFVIGVVKVSAYDVTKVGYIWDYLEKDTFFTGALRGVGWFLYATTGTLLDLCYDTFTAIAKFDVLDIPIVDQIIKNLDVLSPYILTITAGVVLVVRLFDIKNISKVFINMLVVTMLMATFSHVITLIADVKDVGIAEAANVIGVNDYKISDALLADNTVDLKKSLDNGSVQYLDKNNVPEFRHDLRLSKDYLDEDITDKNPDGTYNTESLSDGLWGIGEVHFYRYKTDYWALNVTTLISLIIYLLASFKMAYLLSQWVQENIFGGILMIKGVWNVQSVGKIFKSILSTVFAIIEVYFMMLFFSYFCANIMASESLTNWLAKVIIIYAMGMMIIAGSGFINDSLGIDDGSNFMLRSLVVGRRLSQAAKAPLKMASNAVSTGAAGIQAVGSGMNQFGNYMNSRYAGLLRNVSDMGESNMPSTPPPLPTNRSNPTPMYGKSGHVSKPMTPHTRDIHQGMTNQNLYNGETAKYTKDDIKATVNDKEASVEAAPNDFISDLKDKYNDSLYAQDQQHMEQKNVDTGVEPMDTVATDINTIDSNIMNTGTVDKNAFDTDIMDINALDTGTMNLNTVDSNVTDTSALNSNSLNINAMNSNMMNAHGLNASRHGSNVNDMRYATGKENNPFIDNNKTPIKNHSAYLPYAKNDTVSINPEHVKRMSAITNGKVGTEIPEQNVSNAGVEKEHRYLNAEEMDDLINSLNEWDQQKGGGK